MEKSVGRQGHFIGDATNSSAVDLDSKHGDHILHLGSRRYAHVHFSADERSTDFVSQDNESLSTCYR